MSRIAYVNGRYAPLDAPLIKVQDRGFQFADAVYEVWPVREGALLDMAGHLARLARSLAALAIPAAMTDAALIVAAREVLRRNRVVNGFLYLQISRGAARTRDHTFPAQGLAPTVVMTATRINLAALSARADQGIKAITAPDERWARCDIKTVGLLPNALARQAAKSQGAAEALLVDAAGFITEGAATNVFLVGQDGVLRTRPLSNAILHGVTRAMVLRVAEEMQMPIEERAFSPAEAVAAKEVFVTSAGMSATAIVNLDGTPIGDGRPGPVAQRLRAAYLEGAQAAAKRHYPLESPGSVAQAGSEKL